MVNYCGRFFLHYLLRLSPFARCEGRKALALAAASLLLELACFLLSLFSLFLLTSILVCKKIFADLNRFCSLRFIC